MARARACLMATYPYIFDVEGKRFRVNRFANTDDAFRIWHEFTSHWADAGDKPFPPAELEMQRKEMTAQVMAALPADADKETTEALLEERTEQLWNAYVSNETMLSKLQTRIWRLPYEYVKRLKDDLFRCMEVEITDAQGDKHWMDLSDNEPIAFGDLDPHAATECAVRGFFTHFRNSFSGTRTLFYGLLAEAKGLSTDTAA